MYEQVDSTAIQAVLGRLVQRWEKAAPWIIVELKRCSQEWNGVLLKEGAEKRFILNAMERAYRRREEKIEKQLIILHKNGMLPGKEPRNAKKGQNVHKS